MTHVWTSRRGVRRVRLCSSARRRHVMLSRIILRNGSAHLALDAEPPNVALLPQGLAGQPWER